MKKYVSFFSLILLSLFSICTIAYAASVIPQTLPGNDSNPMDYTPPEGCIHYQIPNSGQEGTFTVTFDETGAVDPNGDFSFTAVVGTEEGEDFTKVLSWSSNFPIYAVIVKGGNAFNLYQYDTSVRGDTDLVSPDNASGKPANVSHVSVVICPEDYPPTPPTPTPSPTPTPTPTLTPTPTPIPCPPCPPCPPNILCSIGIFIILIILIVAFFLIGFISCKVNDPCCRKYPRNKDYSENTNIYVENKDYDVNKDIDINKNVNNTMNNNMNMNKNLDFNKEINKEYNYNDYRDCDKHDPCGQNNHKNDPQPNPKKDYYNKF